MQRDVVTDNLPRDIEDWAEERCIGVKGKAALNQLASDEWVTLVKEPVDNILRPSYHNGQNVIRSVLYNVV